MTDKEAPPYKRIDGWISRQELGEKEDEVKNFLYNFHASNPDFNKDAIVQMKYELYKPGGPLFSDITEEIRDKLLDGLLILYNKTIPDLITLSNTQEN
ncbi:hypothetical protein GF336_03290 [Candidatus Woesearchaeota archaeon]|nr:hypothetical protein [Candidatus Woesearchaeota archaeon]